MMREEFAGWPVDLPPRNRQRLLPFGLRRLDLDDATIAPETPQATKLASDKLDFTTFDALLESQDPFRSAYVEWRMRGSLQHVADDRKVWIQP